MKKIALKISFFLLLVAAADYCIGWILARAYTTAKSGNIAKANYAINACKEDIVFIGASDVTHHIISKNIADSLQMSCFNLGIDGLNSYFQLGVLQSILKRYTPKIIVISTNILADSDVKTKADIKSLLPYCNNHPAIKALVTKTDSSEQFKLWSKCYPYNSLLLDILQGNIKSEPNTFGYKALYGTNAALQLNTNPPALNFTKQSLENFKVMLAAAKQQKCAVYIFQAPRYQSVAHAQDQALLLSLANEYKVGFLNYVTDTAFINHRNYFKDAAHLNNSGATLLTQKIITVLKHTTVNH
ncbi:MAG: hypothetical protein ACOYKE_09785 [Ferruginibacter sp.]